MKVSTTPHSPSPRLTSWGCSLPARKLSPVGLVSFSPSPLLQPPFLGEGGGGVGGWSLLFFFFCCASCFLLFVGGFFGLGVFCRSVCGGRGRGGACSFCCRLWGRGVLFCDCLFFSLFLLPGSPFRLSALSQSRGDNPDGGCRPLLCLFQSFQCGGHLLAPPMD